MTPGRRQGVGVPFEVSGHGQHGHGSPAKAIVGGRHNRRGEGAIQILPLPQIYPPNLDRPGAAEVNAEVGAMADGAAQMIACPARGFPAIERIAGKDGAIERSRIDRGHKSWLLQASRRGTRTRPDWNRSVEELLEFPLPRLHKLDRSIMAVTPNQLIARD